MCPLPRLNRRQAIGVTAATLAAAVVGNEIATRPSFGQAPTVLIKQPRKLRVLGTHVTLQEELRLRAQKDLGIDIEFFPGGDASVLHRASTQPATFDLYEQWSDSIRILWQAGAIQRLDTQRLANWNEINQLSKTGRLTATAEPGVGDVPNKILYVQDDGTLGSQPTSHISFLPYVHNVDSFGYDAGKIPRGVPYETESWAWLLDEQWAGKVAIVNAPTIGLFDLALAAQAKGFVKFNNIGDMTRRELDELFAVLLDFRRRGHFRGIWNSVPRSVKLMQRGESWLESMFSPAVFDLQSAGIDCVYASPREGYRAWHGVMCLSSATKGWQQDAAYDYMNWWLSGWPGAFIARQGYYIANPERSRTELSTAEWDYWYMGKPAATNLIGTNGLPVVRKGQVRDGGSYEKRFSKIAVWNTVMRSYEYSLARWNDFLSA